MRTALALALLVLALPARAEPVVVASGAYPEGLMWHDGRIYFTEMGADRVTIIENGGTREFWRLPGPRSYGLEPASWSIAISAAPWSRSRPPA